MSEKRLGAKQLDYATDIVNILEPIVIDVTDQTEQEKQLKQRVIDAINDSPKKKKGYLVMEIKDRERQGMTEKRFTIKPQDDYWAVVDNYNGDKVCIINGIHTEIEAIWLCNFMNEQQATISDLKDENEQLKEERNYFERKKCEYFNKYNKKHLDNIQLKEENEQLKKRLEHYKEVEAMNGDGKNE